MPWGKERGLWDYGVRWCKEIVDLLFLRVCIKKGGWFKGCDWLVNDAIRLCK